MEQTYWLHIIESKSPDHTFPSTYMLARANAPLRNFKGGAMPTVHHPSWENLRSRLAECLVGNEELEKAKQNLDQKGSHTLTQVRLDDQQVRGLGFNDI
ncbi:MAG TPA: hypothetical protein VMT05_04965 [Terriglobales bacterium]|jgi:hypothetical protein|nr:hypothetical protein [Terriglobales bacterium]